MRTALCYGDSNTWGFDPATRKRYAIELRWTSVLARELGAGWNVVPEGLNGRTTTLDDPIVDGRNGASMLLPVLRSHMPLDLVVLMLGTNDLKRRFAFAAFDVAEGAGRLVEMIRTSGCGVDGDAPTVLVAAPAPILERPPFDEAFAGGREKSLRIKEQFARMGEEKGVPVLFVEDVARSSEIDGVHLQPEAHRAIGAALARRIESLFAD